MVKAFAIYGVKFSCSHKVIRTFAIVKVKKFSAMKKINWWRVAFVLLMFGMFVLESCSLFKPKCNCPHF